MERNTKTITCVPGNAKKKEYFHEVVTKLRLIKKNKIKTENKNENEKKRKLTS